MAKHLKLVFAVLIIASLVLLPVVSCTQAEPTPTPTTAAKAATATPAAKVTTTAQNTPVPTAPAAAAADKITIGVSQEPDTLIQDVGSMYAAAVVKTALGTETTNSSTGTLTWRDDKNNIIPGIAESVPTIENGGAKLVGEGVDKHLEVTFKLRKNVKWHDGSPVTSKDVKYEWEVTMSPDFPIVDRSSNLKIYDVLTPDDYTATFVFMSEKQAKDAAKNGSKLLPDPKEYQESGYAEQSGPVLDPLYNRYGAVMPSALYSKIKPADLSKSEYARKPVGMGPYKLKEWVAGQSITLEANADYFLGAPKVKTLVFKFVSDTNALLAQLQTGELDGATEDGLQMNNIPDYDRIEKEGKMKFYYTPAMVWEHMDFNMSNEFLKDANLRKAIAQATNRQGIVDQVLYGKTVVGNSWITSNHWAYNDKITKYAYNVQAAKTLLTSNGYAFDANGKLTKGGKQIKFKLTTTSGNKQRELTTQIIQQNLKDIGIDIELQYLPSTQFFATEGKGPLSDGTYELALYAWVAGDDPGGQDLWLSKNIPTKENAYAGQNYPHWNNPEADKLLIQANSVLSQTERKPLYDQQQVLFANDLPTLPIFQRVNISAAKAKMQNWKPAPTNTPPTWNCQEWFLPKS